MSRVERAWAGELRGEAVGRRVLLQGWVHRRRDLGGLVFLDLRDRSGIAQVVVRPEEQPEVARALDAVRAEWVVEVEGEVGARDEAAINQDMPTGAIEVIADRAVVLSASDPVPVAAEGQVDANEDTRLRHRYLELRRGTLQRNLRLRHEVTLEILRHFDDEGFLHVETPILTRSTPEGARDYLVPSRVHRGSFYALPQSPQLFKQLCMVAGLERYVQIARCFRDEDLRADRQPEFTQVDVEMSFIDEEAVYDVIERLFVRLFRLIDVELEVPFPRIEHAEAMRRFGSDKPDLRFGMEIVDLSEAVAGSGFRAFQGTLDEGGVIRGVRVPGLADASRKQLDGWAETARAHGAAGVLAFRRRGGATEFQVKNVLDDGQLAAATAALGLEEGDLGLVAAGDPGVVAASLGALRSDFGESLGLIESGKWSFTWVTRFPLVEWDDAEKRWFSCNHPFTAPAPDDVDRLDSDPAAVRARAYDIVLNGFEVGGGSIRIHDRALQERVFGLLGIAPDEARDRFGFLLDALRYGAPPHGGIALGLDRIVMLMAGASSLRDVIAFPKTTSATDLMTAAPSIVDERQLRELGLDIRRGSGE